MKRFNSLLLFFIVINKTLRISIVDETGTDYELLLPRRWRYAEVAAAAAADVVVTHFIITMYVQRIGRAAASWSIGGNGGKRVASESVAWVVCCLSAVGLRPLFTILTPLGTRVPTIVLRAPTIAYSVFERCCPRFSTVGFEQGTFPNATS